MAALVAASGRIPAGARDRALPARQGGSRARARCRAPSAAQPIQGFYLLTPLGSRDGSIVIVNRGFVPTELRDPATPARASRRRGDLHGAVRAPEKRGWFMPENDPARNIWFTRDPQRSRGAKGLDRVAPFFIDADAGPDPGGWPRGGQTRLAIPNNHLQYALTWFGLALTLAGVFGAFAWRRPAAGDELVPSPPGRRKVRARSPPKAFRAACLHPRRGARARLRRRAACRPCPRRRPLRAARAGRRSRAEDDRGLRRPALCRGREGASSAPFVGGEIAERRSRPHGRRGLRRVPPSGGRAARPDRRQPVRARAVPRPDARLQGRGDAAARRG